MAPTYPFTSPFLFPVASIFPYGPSPFVFNVIRSFSPFKSFPIIAVTVNSFPNNVVATGSVSCILFASFTSSVESHTKNLAHLLVPLISFDLFSIFPFPFLFYIFSIKNTAHFHRLCDLELGDTPLYLCLFTIIFYFWFIWFLCISCIWSIFRYSCLRFLIIII